jgi:hypothetical protein
MYPLYCQFCPVFPPSAVVFGVFSDCLEWNLLLKPILLFALLSCVKLLQPDIVFLAFLAHFSQKFKSAVTANASQIPHNFPFSSVGTSRRLGLMYSIGDRTGNDQRLVSFKIMILYIPKAFFLISHNSFALMFTYCRYKCVFTKLIMLPIVRKYFQLFSTLKHLNK